MKKEILAVGMCLVVVLVVFSSGCLETEKKEYVPSGNTTTDGGTSSGGKLTILSHNMTVEYYYGYYDAKVTGQAKNTGDARLSYASVDVKFYDANGALLGTSSDGVSDLDPNETWNFDVTYMDDTEIASYMIAVGSCW